MWRYDYNTAHGDILATLDIATQGDARHGNARRCWTLQHRAMLGMAIYCHAAYHDDAYHDDAYHDAAYDDALTRSYHTKISSTR